MSEALYPNLPVLIVDDEKSWLHRLAITLKRSAGITHSLQCHDSREVPKILARQQVSLILLDLTMPHLSGDQLLPKIIEHYPEIPVIMLSGMNQIETAVKCVKLGAFDYLVKTVGTEALVTSIRSALSHIERQKENHQLKDSVLHNELKQPKAFADIVTQNQGMLSIFRHIEAIAVSSEPVLITGESGVGKERIARAVQILGRPAAPWVAVNAAGLDDVVFADTLFGHTKGAFTGADRARDGMIAKAGNGTLYLDEIGDLSSASQIKLLRLLQEGEYFPLGCDVSKHTNVRYVFATNQDLAAKQAKDEFRQDLYYRLCSHHIHIPSLRERADDIPLLLEHFLTEAARAMQKRVPTPPPELAVLLASYQFPGNVRQLRAMVYDAVSLHRGGMLSMDSFKQAMDRSRDAQHSRPLGPQDGLSNFSLLSFSDSLPTIGEAGNLLVAEAMKRSRGNQAIAARLLGLSRQALNKRLNKTTS